MTNGLSYLTHKVTMQRHNAIEIQEKKRVKKYLYLRSREFLGDSNSKSNE